jgi:hypothetical protein
MGPGQPEDNSGMPMPLTGMGNTTYLGFAGGLYSGGNTMPQAHQDAGIAFTAAVEPLNTAGSPDADGKYVLISVGMSNTTQEFCGASGTACNAWTFAGQAAASASTNDEHLAIVDGARGGQPASAWESSSSENYDVVRDQRLAPLGLTEAQVQIAWVKQANATPSVSLPDADADAFDLQRRLGNIVRSLKLRYPNLKLVFLSSRIYAGYATTGLNPEPFAFESGLAVKWLIQAQVDQMANGGAVTDEVAGDLNYESGGTPWIAWGPYLWADGATPNADGLAWLPDDFESDGTHPSRSGEEKVATRLLQFFESSPHTTGWFLSSAAPPPPPPSSDTLVGVPLIDMTGAYLGFEGGLYPGGVNVIPQAHFDAGSSLAAQIEPRDINGNPDQGGQVVLLTQGMSNTGAHSARFTSSADADPEINSTTLTIVNGSVSGASTGFWDDPTESSTYGSVATELSDRGLSEAQVQVVWALHGNPSPDVSLPDANADAFVLLRQFGDVLRAIKTRYPNIRLVFFSSRIYSCARSGLNPEPYAYESGFSVKWLIEAQINQLASGTVHPTTGDLSYETGVAPWVAWGPYLWADNGNGRSDGLVWQDSDLASDCTHPSGSGAQKVADMLIDFFKTSPLTSGWFVGI